MNARKSLDGVLDRHGGVMAAAQGPPPEVRKRIDAFVEAFASGDPVGFTLPCTWQPCGDRGWLRSGSGRPPGSASR